jgi:hypothetical protein
MVSFGRFRRRIVARKDPARTLLNIFVLCLMMAGMWFVCLNIAPYVKFVESFSRQVLRFGNDPVAKGILFSFGCSLWAILQFLQLFPILLFSNEKFMKTLIDKSDKRQKVVLKETDEPIVSKLKTAYNALPTSFVANLEKWCVISYLLDFYINCTINSPIRGGFEVIGDMLLYGRFELLNWANILLNIQTIFAVEFIILMLIWSLGVIVRLRNDDV